MAILFLGKCPKGLEREVQIENLDRCSESGKCPYPTCRYNKGKQEINKRKEDKRERCYF